ncbi:MAG: hypothetical protein FWG55_08170 [Candidatus Bathyarchaeota archaeon]|nr:hypothetical protein [Candidatus Termiticorpusculum sp.]
MSSDSRRKLDTDSKSVIVNIILVVNALVWYLYFSVLRNNSGFTGNDLVIIAGFSLLAVVLSAVLSTKLIQKVKDRLKFIVYWMAIGVLLSPVSLLVTGVSFFGVMIISGIIGLYFGLGFPVLLGYCSATTENVNRGKVSGLIVFFTITGFALIALIAQSPAFAAVVLTVWKLGGLIAIVLLRPPEAKINTEERVSYRSILKMRSVLLYFVPWLIFSIVNNFVIPVVSIGFHVNVNFVVMVENVIAGFFAVFFGFLADRFGRKYLLVFGFTMLGLGYATLGFFSTYGKGLLFYMLADGIAWGAFTTLFLLTLWGDIAGKRDSEKFFVIGFLPFLFSNFLEISFGQYLVSSVTDLIVMFSFISFFLFLAVIPLYLAPETLSEKDMKDKEFHGYLEKAQRMAEKVDQNSEKKK